MKNFKLLLAGAIIIAVGSSFAASESSAAGEYVLVDGVYQLKSDRPDTGACEQSNDICDYTKINPNGNNTDSQNFQPYRAGTWVE
ncbi:DUF6520 family protein [Pedobacter sp. KLB.chiD]|uniref:DUF6520 family protein n=1 Tax=Pedobacter sp. KLB.chiD TaxID=3387402 RepID=UPI003999D482